MSASTQRKLKQAYDHLRNGDIAAAAALCESVLARAPRNPDALWLLGSARLMEERPADAVPLLERAIAGGPAQGAVLENLAVAYLMLSRFGDAEAALRKAAALPGAPASVQMRLGLALLNQGRHAQAQVELEKALARAPGDADTLYNLGLAAVELGDFANARVRLEQCVKSAPQHREAREHLSAVYLALGRIPQARELLRNIVQEQPGNAGALCAFAEATFQSGALDEAIDIAARARDLDPAASGPYSLLSQIHHVRGELDLAAQAAQDGYARTGSDTLLGMLVYVSRRQCDWDTWAPAWARMALRLDGASDLGSPFWLLTEDTTPQQQLDYTRAWVARRYPSRPQKAEPRAPRTPRPRLRLGYYSGDFHQHPLSALLVEVLELHDRGRFEVFVYSYGPDDKTAMRGRVERAAEHFIDVAWDPDDAVAARLCSDELDLLVDLKGYTVGDRLGVLSGRPCPIQLEWLGYPGTTGADFIDYVIADAHIVPPGCERFYSERVLRLPHSYQANDSKRGRPAPKPRREYGLPDDAFVFCCFNQSSKVTPQVYSRWMALLQSLPQSVLWVPHDNAWATRNLMSIAERHGVGGRVVIAPRVPLDEHLARYAAADLALDTFPYTSHTTGSEALWMGCPLVALCGDTFAARVSTSLLVSCGLADLVTHTLDEYEALARRLATDAALMRDVRARAAAAHATAPLFDTAKFVRDLEALYEQAARA